MLPIQKILHPTDFSPQAAYAHHLACALARDYGARLILLHVRSLVPAGYGEFGAFPPEPPESVEELEHRLQAMEGSSSVECIVVDGVAAEEIVKIAGEKHCDLIVMGTHGRTGLSRLLMGSVADLVVRNATCPVLTVKSPAGRKPHKVEQAVAGETDLDLCGRDAPQTRSLACPGRDT